MWSKNEGAKNRCFSKNGVFGQAPNQELMLTHRKNGIKKKKVDDFDERHANLGTGTFFFCFGLSPKRPSAILIGIFSMLFGFSAFKLRIIDAY